MSRYTDIYIVSMYVLYIYKDIDIGRYSIYRIRHLKVIKIPLACVLEQSRQGQSQTGPLATRTLPTCELLRGLNATQALQCRGTAVFFFWTYEMTFLCGN